EVVLVVDDVQADLTVVGRARYGVDVSVLLECRISVILQQAGDFLRHRRQLSGVDVGGGVAHIDDGGPVAGGVHGPHRGGVVGAAGEGLALDLGDIALLVVGIDDRFDRAVPGVVPGGVGEPDVRLASCRVVPGRVTAAACGRGQQARDGQGRHGPDGPAAAAEWVCVSCDL